MPFTIGGEWIPESHLSTNKQPKQPVKVLKERRKNSIVTLILHLPDLDQMKSFCSQLKQQFGCGGSVKDKRIELQGDKVEQVKEWLKQKGIKAH